MGRRELREPLMMMVMRTFLRLLTICGIGIAERIYGVVIMLKGESSSSKCEVDVKNFGPIVGAK